MKLIYVIGAPGAGKSTLLRHVEAPWGDPIIYARPIAHRDYDGLVSLGREREQFSGTDTLSMSAGPKAMEWLSGHPFPLVLAEGDRLAYPAFFDGLRAAGVDLRVVLLRVKEETGRQRRAERGSAQNDSWVRGRERKAANLVTGGHVTDQVDGDQPAERVAKEFLAMFPELRRRRR